MTASARTSWRGLSATPTGYWGPMPYRDRVPTDRRIGLVLGAGGSVGCAYHAGVLFSIEHHLGWDPRRAHAIVGTSAGSVVGSLLRVGIGTEDLIALFTGTSPTDEHRDIVEEFQQPVAAHRMASWHALARIRPPTPRGVARSLRHRSLAPAAL